MSFSVESDISIRSTLVKIAWRTKSLSAIPFLAEALDDREPDVWKEALDGLISLENQSALDVMRHARARAKAEKSEWLEEAIEQITEVINDSGHAGQ